MRSWSRVKKEVLEDTSIGDGFGRYSDTLRRSVRHNKDDLAALTCEVRVLTRNLDALTRVLGYRLTHIASTPDKWEYVSNTTAKEAK